MKKLMKVAPVLARALEVLHWVGTFVMLALFILSLLSPAGLKRMGEGSQATYGEGNVSVSAGVSMSELEDVQIYGVSMRLSDEKGELSIPAVRIFALAGTLIMGLMSMVFRNICLCIRTAQGQTSFSKGVTPFQEDIVRMVREMGIFYLLIPVIGLIAATAAGLLVGIDAVESNVGMDNIFTGMILLLLSGVFEQGREMQQDIEGLV